MNDSEKLAAFKALLADDELAQRVLADATSSEKTADAMGVAFKEVDLNSLGADELLEIAIARKEVALKGGNSQKMDDKEEEEETSSKGDYATKMGGYMTKMDGYMTKMDGHIAKMEKMFGQREKEAGTVAAVQDASIEQSQRIAHLEETIKSLSGQLTTAVSSLKELKGDVPPGVLNGVRPTEDSNNIDPQGEPIVEKSANGAGGSPLGDFVDFVYGQQG